MRKCVRTAPLMPQYQPSVLVPMPNYPNLLCQLQHTQSHSAIAAHLGPKAFRPLLVSLRRECNIGAPSDVPREAGTQSAGIPRPCDAQRENARNSDKPHRPSRGEVMAALVGLWNGDMSAAEAMLVALLDE